jgi:uncharacterized integral membrane protein (TIGR00697 family)
MYQQERNTSPYLIVISGLFITSLILSNIIAGKLITVAGLVLPGAVILFPIAYIFGDILTEVYGYGKARIVIWTGFACNLLMVGVFALVIAIPSPEFFASESAFATVLGMAPRVVTASLLGYLVGEFTNSIILSRMKIATKGRWLWTRTIGSTVVGEGLDTVVFITLAFWGVVSLPVLGQMMLAQYLWKVAYEILLTPVTYAVVGWLKKKEGMDTFDHEVNYNPFRVKTKIS